MKISEKKWTILTLLSSSLFLFILLAPGFHEAFFPIDDQGLFNQAYLKNPWHWSSLKTLWTPGNSADYYPIRDMSVWLDWTFAKNLKVDTTVPQIQNFLWLIGTAILFFLLLNQISKKYFFNSLLVSAWLLHPFHLESLHWISSRKDLMSWFFMMASCLMFLRLVAKPQLKLFIAVCVLFLFAQFSKAGFLAVPFAVFGWFAFEKVRNKKKYDPLIWATLMATSGISILMVIVNYWNYTSSNYMQMAEEPGVRVLSVLSAFGRNVVGAIVPFYNAVDVEPWGGWYFFNQQFLSIGILALTTILVLLILSSKKERSIWRLYLLIILAILIMTPGFNPMHRSYYSIRYFEPLLFVIWVWIATLAPPSKWSIGIAAGVLVYFAGMSAYDSPNWESNYAILKNSYLVSPEDPSTRGMLLFEMYNIDSWGRLEPTEQKLYTKLYNANLQECIFSDEVNGRCLKFLVHLNPLINKFSKSNEEREKILKISIDRIVQIKEKTFSEVAKAEVALTFFHLKLNNGILDKELLREYFTAHASFTDDFTRIRYLLLNCLDQGANNAQKTYRAWTQDYLIDPEEVHEFVSELKNEELRHQVQACFGAQKQL